MDRTTLRILLAAAPVLAAASPAAAQIRASEAGSVSQTLDGTTVTLEYHRPSARGRELFGAIVPWDVVWTPGANWATTLEVDRAIRLSGVRIPEGRYSLWMTPHADAPWTLTLNADPELFHYQKPDSASGAYHVRAEARPGAHTEMLTWSFPHVVGDAATLRMAWGGTTLDFQVIAQPTEPVAVAAEDRALYTGAYDMTFAPVEPWLPAGRFEVIERGGTLRGRLPFPLHPGDELEFDLVPAGFGRFNPGLYRGGELFNIEMAITFVFDVGERAEGVKLMGIEGSTFGEGGRAAGTTPEGAAGR